MLPAQPRFGGCRLKLLIALNEKSDVSQLKAVSAREHVENSDVVLNRDHIQEINGVTSHVKLLTARRMSYHYGVMI